MKHVVFAIAIALVCFALGFLVAPRHSQTSCLPERQDTLISRLDSVVVQVDTSYDCALEEFDSYYVYYEYGVEKYYPMRIKYRQPVNGYKVSATWFVGRSYGCIYGGLAILKFVGEGNDYFFVASESFYPAGFEDILYGFYDSGRYIDYRGYMRPIANVATNIFTLDYTTNPHPEDSLDYRAPFFFSDVDFDGKQELVLTLYRMGQRGVNEYKVYKFDGYYNNNIGEVKEKPYTLLDDLTTFDYENKKVFIHHSCGAAYSYDDVYRYCDSTYLPLVFEKSGCCE